MVKNKAVVNAGSKIAIENMMFTLEAELNLPAGSSVLGVCAVSRVLNCEALNGELRVSGKLTAKIIFRNAEGAPDSWDFSKEFAETASLDIAASDKAFLTASVVEIEPSDSKAVFTVNISGYYIKESELEYLECQGELFTKKNALEIQCYHAVADANINVSKGFECRFPVKRILCYNTVCHINNLYSYDGLYQAEGEAVTSVLAIGDEDALTAESFSQEFLVEVADPKALASSTLSVDAAAKSTTILLEEEGGRNIIIDLEIALKGVSASKKDVEVLSDAYSMTKELDIVSEVTAFDTGVWQWQKAEQIKSVIKCDDEISGVEAVLAPVAGAANLVDNFGTYAEGIVSVTALYRDKDGVLKSVCGNIPYQILVDSGSVKNASAKVVVKSAAARVKTNNELEVVLDIWAAAGGSRRGNVVVITDITEVGDKPDNDVAISLYIANENDELWDVAKMLSADEETLLRLNPDVKLPLQGGEKLLIYRELGL